MRTLLVRLGHIKSIVVLTILALLMSIAFNTLFLSFMDKPIELVDIYKLIIICPLLIAPIILHFILKLLFELNLQEQKMRQYAQRDSLSNFLTRRAWFEFAEQYEVIAKRQNKTFTLLMLDLDNFKKINDDYGHIAGDSVIKTLGKVTQKIARESDIIGRFGGEEFIFLLPDTNAEKAYALCERLHDQIRNTTVEFEQHQLTFTFSVGLACQTADHTHSLDHLISLADNALYTAKSRGKNCSFLHRESANNSAPSFA